MFVFDVLQITGAWIALLAPHWICVSLQHYCFSFSYLANDLAAHSGGQKVFLSVEYTGLFKMIVGVLTTCHTQQA